METIWERLTFLISCFFLFLVEIATSCKLQPMGGGGGGGGAGPGAKAVWDSACDFGGLTVIRGPYTLTDKECDWTYLKEDWQEAPIVKYPAAQEVKVYTIFALDPDAPAHPEGVYYLHMLKANVKGADLMNGDFSNAYNIADWTGPAPPPMTGYHRYMFVAYLHKDGFKLKDLPQMDGDTSRLMFDLKGFLSRHGTGLVGPVAGLQFKAGF